MNLYSFNCSYIENVCSFVVQSPLERSIRVSVYFSSENSLWTGFISPSLLTSPFSRIPCLAFTSEMLSISPAILDWSTCHTSPNNGPILAGDGFQQVVSLFCQNLHPLTFSFLFTWLEISNNMGTASILATLNCNYEGTSLSHDVKSVAFWLLLQRWKSWSFFSPVVPLAFFYISSGNWKQSYCCVIVLGMNRMNSILLVLECS